MKRAGLAATLVTPLLLVPAIGMALMEFGPERSVLFALYPLVWAVLFLAAGIIGMLLRPPRPPAAILRRAALWATGGMILVTSALLGASFLFHP